MSEARLKTAVTKFLIVGIAALCCVPTDYALGWTPLASWQGLILGIVIAYCLGNPYLSKTRALTPNLLAWSVVGLGASMNLQTVAEVGLQGFGYTLVGISLTLLIGVLIGWALGIKAKASILVSVGTAVCGGSAIAAVSSVIRADEEETSVSLATVFLLNSAALLIFPVVGHYLGLSERAFGLWAALGIHDTSSVVGATMGYGNEALVVATATKLARALWIVPLTLVFGFWISRSEKGTLGKSSAKKPWFILGFLLAAALVTYVPELQPVGQTVTELAKRGMVLTLFLLGLGLNRANIAAVGVFPFLQGILLWIMAGGGTLAAIQLGWVG